MDRAPRWRIIADHASPVEIVPVLATRFVEDAARRGLRLEHHATRVSDPHGHPPKYISL